MPSKLNATIAFQFNSKKQAQGMQLQHRFLQPTKPKSNLHQLLDLSTSQLIKLKSKTNRTRLFFFPKQHSKRCCTHHSSTPRSFKPAQPYLRYKQQFQRMRSKVNVQKILKLNPQHYDFTNNQLLVIQE